MNPKTLFANKVSISQVLEELLQEEVGDTIPFKLNLTEELILGGKIRFIYNEFTKMPRGQIKLRVSQQTLFKKSEYANYQNIVYMFSKNTS